MNAQRYDGPYDIHGLPIGCLPSTGKIHFFHGRDEHKVTATTRDSMNESIRAHVDWVRYKEENFLGAEDASV